MEVWSVDDGGTAATDRSLSFAVTASLDCSVGIRDLVCPEGETVCYGAGRQSDGDEDSWLIAFDWTTWTLDTGIVSGGNQVIDSAAKDTDGFNALALWSTSAALADDTSLGTGTTEVVSVGREGDLGSVVVRGSGSTAWITSQIDGQPTIIRRASIEGDCLWAQGITTGKTPKLFICKYCRNSKTGNWEPDTSFGTSACWKEDLDDRDVQDFKVLGGRPMLLYRTGGMFEFQQLYFRQVGVDGGAGFPATERFSGRQVWGARFTRCSSPGELPKVEYSWGAQHGDFTSGTYATKTVFLSGEGPRHLWRWRTDALDISFDLGDVLVEELKDIFPGVTTPGKGVVRWPPISELGTAEGRPATVAVTRGGSAADDDLVLFRLEAPELLFYDGFHTGDTTRWSSATP